jgi:hypothetical protein
MMGLVQVWGRSAEGEVASLSSEFRVLAVDISRDHEIYSLDGRAQLFLPAGCLERNSAVGIMPGAFLARPVGLVPLSRPYHIGVDPASDELVESAVMTLYYNPLGLRQVVSGSVGLYRWDQSTETWEHVGGKVRPDLEFVTGRITRLGTYAIMGEAKRDARTVYLPVILR